MNFEKLVGFELLQDTIGVPVIEEISNDFEEHTFSGGIEDSFIIKSLKLISSTQNH